VAGGLFGNSEPLGQSVVIRGSAYVVVGVLARADPPVAKGLDLDRAVLIPLRTCRARFGERVVIRRAGARMAEAVPLTEIQVTVSNAKFVPAVAEAIRGLLREAHEKQDWEVVAAAER
jgi:putative ABC transport system permease protein